MSKGGVTGKRKKERGFGDIWGDKSFNAGGRRPPIRADRREPQRKAGIGGYLKRQKPLTQCSQSQTAPQGFTG